MDTEVRGGLKRQEALEMFDGQTRYFDRHQMPVMDRFKR